MARITIGKAAPHMHAVHTRPSLMTRIVETERRASVTRDDPYQPRRQQQTFTERYRGTEFDNPRSAVADTQAPLVSRGRSFVLVTGAAAIGFLALVVNAALTA